MLYLYRERYTANLTKDLTRIPLVRSVADFLTFRDATRDAVETVGKPRYPLDLFLRVITVSLETMRIVWACRDWTSKN